MYSLIFGKKIPILSLNMSFRIVLHSKIPEPLEANIQEDDLSQEGIDTMPK